MRSSVHSLPLALPHFDVICIGGGPANLALSEELLALPRRPSVLILDLGRAVEGRHCPLASQGRCPPCQLCHAVHGIAGAGAYSDGKVSFWPAGSGLLPLAGSLDTMLSIDASLRRYYHRLRGAGSTATTCADAAAFAATLPDAAAIAFKGYDVIHAGSEAIQEFYLEKQLMLQTSGASLLTRSRVTDITRCEDGDFLVSWQQGRELHAALGSYTSLGTGKASGRWLRYTLSKLGVHRRFTEIEPGIRLEMPLHVTARLANCHRDAKIKLTAGDGSEVRTFCLCPGGFVLAAYYDDMTTVSGYSLRDRRSQNTNLALVNRISLPSDIDPYEEVLPSIREQNRRAEGGATVQRLGDFLKGVPTTAADLGANPVRPTLATAVSGRIDLPLDERVRPNLLDAIHRLDQICPGFADPANLVYGPVLEKCWDQVSLSTMRTTAPRVFVVGDAAGHARGLVQAAATGILAARAIAEDSHAGNQGQIAA